MFTQIFKITLFFVFLIPCNASSQSGQDHIQLNQVGFYPKGPKQAIVTGPVSSKEFFITSTNLGDTFYRGVLSEEKLSPYSSTICHTADFSVLTRIGAYQVVIPSVGHSYNFVIAQDVHREVARASIKGYYYQRCSMDLDPQYAGKWFRSSGHPDTKVFIHPSAEGKNRPAESIISTPGGWYDAGDYNKYIVNSGISMGTLLSALEDFPDYTSLLSTHIPESNNGAPDLLNEVVYNLRWMLSMQDTNDGGVYNKCTNEAFDGMVMPGVTTKKRYVVEKGTAATLDFIAVCAQASRILNKYKKVYPGLADSCIKGAVSGWKWALQNPDILYDQNEMNKKYSPAISTGGYGDNNLSDEWFWAASELFVTTSASEYYPYILKNYPQNFSAPSWNNVGMAGIYSLLRKKNKLPPIATSFLTKINRHLIAYADSLIKNSKSAFNTVIGQSTKDFIWGSNAVAANQSNLLVNAYLTTKDKKYLVSAISNLDYLLGRNATGYCFLTGTGSKSTMHPHHRQSVSDGVLEPVPGLLAGGPNPGRQDGVKYEFTEPETAYIDKSEAYACNEIAINWNAPLVYLVCAMEVFQKKI